MRKVLMVIVACMIVAAALTVFAQTRDLSPIMKEIQPTFGGLTTGTGNGALVGAGIGAAAGAAVATIIP